MKVTITEVRKAKFTDSNRCLIEFTYVVIIDGGTAEIFYSENSANEYLKYLEAKKKDYEKVIKEIEI